MKSLRRITIVLAGIVSLFLFGIAGSIEAGTHSIRECALMLISSLLIEAACIVILAKTEGAYED